MIYLGEESITMAKLTHLYLDHMSLQDLSDRALSGAPLLSHLDLGHNQLRYLEPLRGPKQLGSLNLTGMTVHTGLDIPTLHVLTVTFLSMKETPSTVTAICGP